MNVTTLIRTMTAKRDALKSQLDKLDAAIRALTSYSRKESEEPTPAKRKKDPRYTKRGKGLRIRRVRYKVNCTRCGKEFFYHRNPEAMDLKRRSKNLNHFCGKPCYSGMYQKEQHKKKAQYNPKISGTPGGVTILKGDTLTPTN